MSRHRNMPRRVGGDHGGVDYAGTPGSARVFGTWAVVGFSAIWLVFLADPLGAAWAVRGTSAGLVGLIATACVAALYLLAWLVQVRPELGARVWSATSNREPGGRVVSGWGQADRRGRAIAVTVILVQFALAATMILTLGQSATAALPFVGVLLILWLPRRVGPILVAVLVIAIITLERFVSGWDTGYGVPLSIAASALAVWGIQLMRQRTRALIDARAENARLAVAEERHRMARDLHDVLGHSLTVITVKAELANRLLEVDIDRAHSELNHLERLSRDTLHDVRRAVEGFRDLSLAGELVRAREALEAAEIRADVPTAVDEVPTEVRDLYAWTVREGITNVIRHSGARTCTVRIGPDRLTILDDGAGRQGIEPRPGEQQVRGSGLAGLRERARLARAVISTRGVDPHGFELRVQVTR